MNDKQYEKQKKRVEKLFAKWRTPLGIGWWKVQIRYSRERDDGREMSYAPRNLGEKFGLIFSVTCDYYYQEAVITAFLPMIQEQNDETLERSFLHELMHLHLKAMQSKEKAGEEELTATRLADVILWVVEAVKNKKI